VLALFWVTPSCIISITGFTGQPQSVMGEKTKPYIIVEVIGYVPIAVRSTQIPSIIVPGAAARPCPTLQKQP
jgi:hypothetical protein